MTELTYSEEQILEMGLLPKATYGGNVVSFTCAETGDYVWDIEVLVDALSLIQRRANKLVADRNKKLRELFSQQSKRK